VEKEIKDLALAIQETMLTVGDLVESIEKLSNLPKDEFTVFMLSKGFSSNDLVEAIHAMLAISASNQKLINDFLRKELERIFGGNLMG